MPRVSLAGVACGAEAICEPPGRQVDIPSKRRTKTGVAADLTVAPSVPVRKLPSALYHGQGAPSSAVGPSAQPIFARERRGGAGVGACYDAGHDPGWRGCTGVAAVGLVADRADDRLERPGGGRRDLQRRRGRLDRPGGVRARFGGRGQQRAGDRLAAVTQGCGSRGERAGRATGGPTDRR